MASLTRRGLLVAGAAALTGGCTSPGKSDTLTTLNHRPLSSLPTTELSWLKLRDHFVATVGPSAGSGRPFGSLLVLADATFAPRSRFPLHPHRDMEILSIVIDGTLSHHGDQANGEDLPARTAQLISARSGIVHAEGNDLDVSTRMLQIWFTPTQRGGEPVYATRTFSEPGRHLLTGEGALPLLADARVWWMDLEADRTELLEVGANRRGYLLATTTPLQVRGAGSDAVTRLEEGEGLGIEGGGIEVVPARPGAVLWIDAA